MGEPELKEALESVWDGLAGRTIVVLPEGTPSHPFTPDVVAWLERSLPTMQRAFSDPIGLMNSVGRMDEYAAMLTQARQILAAVGREEPRFVRVPHIGEAS